MILRLMHFNVLFVFVFLFLFGSCPASATPSFTKLSDIEYDQVNGQSLILDLYLPTQASQGPRPAVVLLHGGCFNGGDKSENATEAQDLAGRGFVAAAINYRLAPRDLYPAAIIDSQQAVRYLRKNAHRFQIEPTKIASFGQSAGAYLAIQLGIQEMPDRNGHLDILSDRVAVVGDHYGRTDFTLPQGPTGEDCAQIFLGTTREKNPGLFRAASVFSFVNSRSAPVFIAQGSADPQVAPIHSTELRDALSKARVPNSLLVIPGAGHGFSGSDFTTAWTATLKFFGVVLGTPQG